MEFFLRQVYPWLIEVSSYSPLLPFIIGIYFFRKQKSIQFRLLFLLIAVNVVHEVISQITVIMGTSNNLWSFYIFTPLVFGIEAAIYYNCFTGAVVKKGILVAVGLVAGITIYDAVILEGITQMNSVSRMVTHSFIIVLVIAYFYKIANDRSIVYLDRDPIFLLSCSLLIYYAGTSMSFALFNQALEVSYDAARICLTVVLVLNILFYTSAAFILRRMAV